MPRTIIGPAQVTEDKIEDADSDTYVTVEDSADEDKIRFFTAGNQRMMMRDSDEAVAIMDNNVGDFIPKALLHVSGAGSGGDQLFIVGGGSANKPNALVVDQNGQVGVGDFSGNAANPLSSLSVSGSLGVYKTDSTTASKSEAHFILDCSRGAGHDSTWKVGSYYHSDSLHKFRIAQANTNVFQIIEGAAANSLYIDENSKIGIGTNTPQRTLHVETSEDTVVKFHSTTDKAVLRLSDNDTESFLITKDNKCHIGNTSADLDVFTIDWINTRVGIGTASPTTDLDVNGSIKATGSITAKQRYFTSHKYTATSTSDAVFVRFNAAGSNTSGGVNNRFVAPADGKLLSVTIRTDGTPGNTEIALCKITNGTATFGSGVPTADILMNVSSANTAYVADFSGLSAPHDITFSAGNVLGIRINPTSNHGNVDLTTVWEFDWNS